MSKFSAEKVYGLFDSPANKKLISEISAAGAKIILFPGVETFLISDAQTRETLSNLNGFDWLIFSDVYAVEFFLLALAESNVDLFEIDHLRVCAYGESVADRLRFAQLHADVIPSSVRLEDVFQALSDYISEDEFEKLNFLILREKASQAELKNKLESVKANVAELPIYAAKDAENESVVKIKTLLRGGAIDEFIFTSPFDVLNLAHLFPNENLETVLSETAIHAQDNAAAQSLKEFRLI